MPTRNVVITDQQSRMIDRLVRSGQYQNASEVLREGLRLLDERNRAQQGKLRRIREAVALAVEDVERGDVEGFDTVEAAADFLAQVRREARARRRTAA
jgi:antitoxin ParD1/3/4